MIRDPVHGAIQVDELEWLLIKSRPVQRLRGIKQLGLVDAVYPGAIHTRFEHSLGTMHMA
ncbi:MAG: HD domain-containing protein, partial [Methanothrix sp.]|nr:HD domain-containing protein [Methanothrix sp.]